MSRFTPVKLAVTAVACVPLLWFIVKVGPLEGPVAPPTREPPFVPIALTASFEPPPRVQPTKLREAPSVEVDSSKCKRPLFWGNGGGGAGWTICFDALPANTGECVVYSFGLGADWSFDIVASSPPYSCTVHGFDPSDQNWRDGMHGNTYSQIDYKKQYPAPPRRILHSWGLGSAPHAVYPKHAVPSEWPGLGDPPLSKTNSEPWEMRSVASSMEVLAHKQLAVLKIDVEGSEWIAMSSLLSTMSDSLAAGDIQQLLVEWHWDPFSTLRDARNQDILKKLETLGFFPFHNHTHAGSSTCIDVSYIHKSAVL